MMKSSRKEKLSPFASHPATEPMILVTALGENRSVTLPRSMLKRARASVSASCCSANFFSIAGSSDWMLLRDTALTIRIAAMMATTMNIASSTPSQSGVRRRLNQPSRGNTARVMK